MWAGQVKLGLHSMFLCDYICRGQTACILGLHRVSHTM